jgi:hypothetical protein
MAVHGYGGVLLLVRPKSNQKVVGTYGFQTSLISPAIQLPELERILMTLPSWQRLLYTSDGRRQFFFLEKMPRRRLPWRRLLWIQVAIYYSTRQIL